MIQLNFIKESNRLKIWIDIEKLSFIINKEKVL